MSSAVPIHAVSGDVEIGSQGRRLLGRLDLPESAHGVVLFAHGSGSGRLSPRNQSVARALRRGGIGTLLFDLLTASEEAVDRHTGHLRFDVALLARRLVDATRWLEDEPEASHLPVGYFGASTGSAAALIAASELPARIAAVVSRGGRPDLAMHRLELVRAPTLLIVGGADEAVVELNREAAARLECEHELAIVPGAGHLFEEPGSLERVSALARDWFLRYFARVS